MAHIYHNGSISSSEKNSPSEEAQINSDDYRHFEQEKPVDDPNRLADPTNAHHSLHRGLSARQVSMIAIGGAIGTGLIIGTGKALVVSRPSSILISYSLMGMLCHVTMCGLGEMATWFVLSGTTRRRLLGDHVLERLPAAGGFAPYGTRFVDPALGFALGYTYWFKYIITTPNQLTAAALVIQYWVPPDKVNPGVFIAVFLVTIIIINYLGIRFFGEVEFWLSSIKVLVILGLIILMLVIVTGGVPDSPATGFKYYNNPGAFAMYIGSGATGKFTGFWYSFTNAVFAYLGTELVGVTIGEAQNPQRNIPRAIKLTFWRILIFYVCSVFLLGMALPYNSQRLVFATDADTFAAASPFVVAIQLAGIDFLPGFLNGCILIFLFSASNSDLYIASRTIHGLALKGQAPQFLARTDKRGVQYLSLGLSALITCIAFLNVSNDSSQVFGYFFNLVSIFGLLTWISIVVSHIYFIRARRAQGVPEESLRYKSPFGLWGCYIALGFCCLVALTKNFYVFATPFDYKNFITGYPGIPFYPILLFGWKFVKKTHGLKPHEADLFLGKAVIDADEEEWLAKEAEMKASGRSRDWWYSHTIGYVF